MKLCFHCFKKIPLMAGRCPYCRSEHQKPRGRIIFTLIGLFLVVAWANSHNEKYSLPTPVDIHNVTGDVDNRMNMPANYKPAPAPQFANPPRDLVREQMEKELVNWARGQHLALTKWQEDTPEGREVWRRVLEWSWQQKPHWEALYKEARGK